MVLLILAMYFNSFEKITSKVTLSIVVWTPTKEFEILYFTKSCGEVRVLTDVYGLEVSSKLLDSMRMCVTGLVLLLINSLKSIINLCDVWSNFKQTVLLFV